jgi:beta-aspartyl-dipeptidase (metallo-type)
VFKLLKNGHCFTPGDAGKKDILVAYGTICRMEDWIGEDNLWDVEVFDCSGKIVCPGLIDQHVHIVGGGGEEGPVSRIPEIMLGDIISAGVTTLVGVLGVDDITRNIAGLLAKARAIEAEGPSTYIYTGSYGIPTATLTGKVISDITLIDKIIGVGEVAISDYRSSHPDMQMLKSLAYEARVGGLLGAKAGVVHIHVGDGFKGLTPLTDMLEDSDFPMEMFVPTHLNRSKKLFEQAVEYAAKGGNIDLTAGESSEKGYSIPDAMEMLIGRGVDMQKVTLSSDGNGSMPSGQGDSTGVGKMVQLLNDVRACIVEKKLDVGTVLQTVTSNVARILKLYPKKGILSVGSDADILVLDEKDLSLDTLFIKGSPFIKQGNIIKKGRYEG